MGIIIDKEKLQREMDADLQRHIDEGRRVLIRAKAKELRKYYERRFGKKNKRLIDKKVFSRLYYLYGFKKGEFDIE